MNLADVESEQQVIGGMISYGGRVASDLRAVLPSEAFSDPLFRQVAALVYDMDQRGDPISTSTVAAQMRLQGVGVDPYDWSEKALTWNCSEAVILHHAGLVKESWKRRVAKDQSELVTLMLSNGNPTESIVAALEAARETITPEVESGPQRFPDLIREHPTGHWEMDGVSITGIASGLRELDLLTMGFQRQDYILLAARTSQGKTALGLQIAKHAARSGVPTLIASIEMNAQSLIGRIHSHESKIDSLVLRRGGLKGHLLDRAVEGMGSMANLPLRIWDVSRLTPAMLTAELRRTGVAGGLLVVDYVQLMSDDILHSKDHERVSSISRQLKGIAKEFDMSLLVLAQVKRPQQGSENRPPYLSDLKDSGSLEQDSDVVIFIYTLPGQSGSQRQVQLILAKNRNGPTGTIESTFRREIGEFSA